MKHRMGWIPDYPNFNDYSHKNFKFKTKVEILPESVSLREWCSPIEDQEDLGSCTAHAGIGLIEYYERRNHGTHINASRLFLYKVTRNLMKVTGDTGAMLRTTMGAMTLFGAPPEEYCPYDVRNFDREPSAFLYSCAQNFQALKYFRHDSIGVGPEEVLLSVKTHLAHGRPAMFGFSVYESIEDVGKDGKIPFPAPKEKIVGGHAIVAVGYHDAIYVGKYLGALVIRNSWGKEWGNEGYGLLPYDYILKGLAEDFWSITEKEFVDVDQFKE